MARSERRSLGAFALLVSMLVSGSAAASPLALPAATAPIPAWPGTGLWSRWDAEKAGAFRELDEALPYLSSSTTAVRLDGVGPVSLSNFILPLGDFAEHTPMPFSIQGDPSGEGPFTVGSFRGWWAARAIGTFTLGVGCDDGYRIQLGGTTLLDHPEAQPFRRATAAFTVSEIGLYPIAIEYFNGVQEGAIEISIAAGEIGDVIPTDPIPAAFALIPRADLYPLDALADGSASVPDPWTEGAGSPSSPGSPFASGDPAKGDASSAVPAVTADQTWRGGGCRNAAGHGFEWGPSLLGVVFIVRRARRRRAVRASVHPSPEQSS